MTITNLDPIVLDLLARFPGSIDDLLVLGHQYPWRALLVLMVIWGLGKAYVAVLERPYR